MARGNGGSEGLAICGSAMVCCLVFIVAFLGLGLGTAKIVMGAVNLNGCPLQPMIPVYLIVSGWAPMAFTFSGMRKNDNTGEKSGGGCAMFFSLIGLLFNMAWLISGSIWVYPNYGKTKANNFVLCTKNITTECTKRCHQPLLNFSVAMVTIDWIFFLFWAVLIGCMLRAAYVGRLESKGVGLNTINKDCDEDHDEDCDGNCDEDHDEDFDEDCDEDHDEDCDEDCDKDRDEAVSVEH